ncbi:MAG: sortase, partial [Longilinea sp.]|nr:sortase [Longilinea sp.]
NEDDDDTPTIAAPDLSIVKDDGGGSTVPGAVVIYTLTYANVGNQDATGVVITDTVPLHTTFDLAGSSTGWSCVDNDPAGTLCTYTIGNLAAGASGTITFAVQVDNPLPADVTEILNNALIVDDGSNGEDPDPGNNDDDDDTPTTAAPDLTITKDDGQTVVGPGVTLTYTLTISNVGNQTATGVLVADTLPLLTSFVSASDGGTESSGIVTWPTFTLLAGETVTRTVTVQVATEIPPGETSLLNLGTVVDDGSNGDDPDTGNNEDDDEDQLITMPNEDLSKVLAGSSEPSTPDPNVAIGETITYQVAMLIPVGSLETMTLTDTLDRGLAFQDCISITTSSPEVTTDIAGGFAGVCNTAVFSAYPTGSLDPVDQGRVMQLNFGNVTNAGADEAVLTVRYTVVVLDNAENTRGSTLQNHVVWQWDSGSLEDIADPITILEPDLTLTKSVDPDMALPGEDVTFTLTIAHTDASNQTAWDAMLTDIVPSQLTYIPGSLTYVSGQEPTQLDASLAPVLRVYYSQFLNNGENSVISFRVRMGNLPAGSTVTNTASLSWTSLPGDLSDPQSDYNELSHERFYDPASSVDIYGTTSSASVTVPELPATGFAPGRVTVLPASPTAQPYASLGPIWLEIPRLGVSMPIVGVPVKSGEWDLTWLANQIGWLEGTAYPTWTGNSALTAHVYDANGQPGPFNQLGSLVWGDQIIVHLNGERYIYEVRSIRQILPTDSSVLRHEDRAWLTLITCKGYNEDTNNYRLRVAVKAVLIGVEGE